MEIIFIRNKRRVCLWTGKLKKRAISRLPNEGAEEEKITNQIIKLSFKSLVSEVWFQKQNQKTIRIPYKHGQK